MVKVPKEKQALKEDDNEVPQAAPLTIKLTSKKLKKIKPEGPFGGKNRQVLGYDGKALTEEEPQKEDQRLKGNSLNVVNE
jgi:hypothetical protein